VLAARDLMDRGVAHPAVHDTGAAAFRMMIQALGRPLSTRGRDGHLGVAHGIAGALLAALRWDPARGEIRARLDELLGHASTGDGLILWPRTLGGPVVGPFAGTWCNGIAGFLLLLCRAYEVFGDARYRRAARAAAATTGLLRAVDASVCCGAAGQAIALDRYARLTNRSSDRRRATVRLHRAVARAEALGMGLMQGRLGVALATLALCGRRPLAIPVFDPAL
jgi:serine/threonine-protein kinase